MEGAGLRSATSEIYEECKGLSSGTLQSGTIDIVQNTLPSVMRDCIHLDWFPERHRLRERPTGFNGGTSQFRQMTIDCPI